MLLGNTGAGEEDSKREDRPHEVESEDHFYKGVIAWVHWGREQGVIRSANGREIPFEFPFVRLVGAPRPVESLHPGMRVGFDVGWTSDGLRVTTLKIYD